MSKTPIEEKIALLLAKAESTDSPHEAEALTDAAEKLMITNGITAAMLAAAKGGKVEKIVSGAILFSGIYADTFTNIWGFVAKEFAPVEYYISSKWSEELGKRVKAGVVVGYESDVERVVILLRSLERQALAGVKSFWKKHPAKSYFTPMEAYKERRQFIHSFGIAAAKRVAENVLQTVVETTGSDLVLVDRRAQVASSDEIPKDLRETKVRQHGGSGYAQSEGRLAGKNAATGEKGLGYGQLALGQ